MYSLFAGLLVVLTVGCYGSLNLPKSRFCNFKQMVCQDKNGQKLSAVKGPVQYALDEVKVVTKDMKAAQEETRRAVYKLKTVVEGTVKDISKIKIDLTKISDLISKSPEEVPKDGMLPQTDCKSLYKEGKTANGVYSIRPGTGDSKDAYCYHGFTVLQRRITGNEKFDRTFMEYRNGFGDPKDDHWLGLEPMHQMTRRGSCSLRIMIKLDPKHQDTHDYRQIEVRKFNVLEGDNYEGVFTGPSTDLPNTKGAAGLESYHTKFRFPFATKDNYLGSDRYKCARQNGAGWWYVNCAFVDLNQSIGMDPRGYTGTPNCVLSANNRICAYVYPYAVKETHMLLRC